jgi:hypothetical protein
MAGFTIKRNDRRPRWRYGLTVNGDPMNLTGATAVRFIMKQGSTIKINKLAMTVVDATTGVVEYAWASGDTDTTGTYNVEVEVDWGGSPAELQTFPNEGYFTVNIVDDLA